MHKFSFFLFLFLFDFMVLTSWNPGSLLPSDVSLISEPRRSVTPLQDRLVLSASLCISPELLRFWDLSSLTLVCPVQVYRCQAIVAGAYHLVSEPPPFTKICGEDFSPLCERWG
ncbi:hypothetical protein BDN72DRAFT_266195 [Pluteus cervinus]|uniref:Uncharacterized protein n=1 Tax=Pluteus cervinus TaxID=181527 RepID=A0ACD3B436_9AGAR|nr:hypothetical protein BDN72DRAFT_266195 [Pluteus cervinus]